MKNIDVVVLCICFLIAGVYCVDADAIDAERCVEDYIREEIKGNSSASVEIEEATKCFEVGWVLASPLGRPRVMRRLHIGRRKAEAILPAELSAESHNEKDY